eukprot:jgi/Botrbrau1/13465/Bobra.0082s0065.1
MLHIRLSAACCLLAFIAMSVQVGVEGGHHRKLMQEEEEFSPPPSPPPAGVVSSSEPPAPSACSGPLNCAIYGAGQFFQAKQNTITQLVSGAQDLQKKITSASSDAQASAWGLTPVSEANQPLG